MTREALVLKENPERQCRYLCAQASWSKRPSSSNRSNLLFSKPTMQVDWTSVVHSERLVYEPATLRDFRFASAQGNRRIPAEHIYVIWHWKFGQHTHTEPKVDIVERCVERKRAANLIGSVQPETVCFLGNTQWWWFESFRKEPPKKALTGKSCSVEVRWMRLIESSLLGSAYKQIW